MNDTPKRRLTQRALASALGISPARVAALKKAGMPTNSAPAARRWRSAFVAPYMKSSLARRPVKSQAREPDEVGVADLLVTAALFCAIQGIERYGPLLVHLTFAAPDDELERAWCGEEMPQDVLDAWDDMDEAYSALSWPGIPGRD